MNKNFRNIKNYQLFINENKNNFFNTDNDDYLTSRNKEHDLKIRKQNPQAGDWVNFVSEFGDVWHKIIKVYEPDDYYASIYYYEPINSKSNEVEQEFTYYYKVREISKSLPDNASSIFDESGAYSERRGNIAEYYKNHTTIQENNVRKFKLIFKNQTDDNAGVYRLIKETDNYYFLENVAGSAFTYRVSKKTLKVKAYKEGEDGYAFDVPTAVAIVEI